MKNSSVIYFLRFYPISVQLDFKAHKKGNLLPYNGSINGSFEVGLKLFPSVGVCKF